MLSWMQNWKKMGLVATGAITSGILLNYNVRANERLIAQTPSPSQSQLGQPSGLDQPSGLIPSPSPGTTPRPRTLRDRTNRRDRNNRDRNDRDRTNRRDRNNRDQNNRFNRPTRERRVPIPDVPLPGEIRRRPSQTEGPGREGRDGKKIIPRVPNEFPSPLTGISGQIVIAPVCSAVAPTSECVIRPYQGQVKIMPTSRDRTFRLSTDEQGQFQARLGPGVYIVQPDSTDFPVGTSQTITVVEGMMRTIRMDFQGYVRPQPGVTGQSTQARQPGQFGQPGQPGQFGQPGQPFPQATTRPSTPPAPQLQPNGFLKF